MILRSVQHVLRQTWLVAVVLTVGPFTAGDAQPLTERNQPNTGSFASTSPRLPEAARDKAEIKVDPTHRFEFADHVANGIAMRNRTVGTIHL